MTRVEALRVDAREAVSSLNGTSGARNYFFVDIRPAADHDGILATGVRRAGARGRRRRWWRVWWAV